ncbi:MAG: TPM domain-containing protein, partial [Candidatus Omnitrophota bacterium]|nr:TPM domain-containing protein [Candidatus Omnitrophota bacterium]
MFKKWLFAALVLISARLVFAESLPQPQGWVNDFAGVLSAAQRDKITGLIEELEKKTTAEIFVVAVDSIAPYDEKEYARLLFDNWKPGKKGKDNGVLVLLAVKERRWRIETGYGVEGVLPDGLCGEIGRNYMVPDFKAGKYGEGLYSGVSAVANVIAKDAQVKLDSLAGFKATEDSYKIPPFLALVIIMAILLLPLFRFLFFFGGLGGGYYSGGGGFGGGGFGSGGFGGGGF